VLDKLKIAIVCDWLTVFAGAERVIYEMHQLFPNAPIYTTVYDPKGCPQFAKAEIHESFKFFPFAKKAHRLMLPFMPRAFESMDLSSYDLVISSCHSASKGIITPVQTLHVCYCHSPMRYVWDQSHSYVKQFKGFALFGFLYRPILHNIRMWDRVASARVDKFLANSAYVGERISKYYKRESTVLYPPVDIQYFTVSESHEDYYLAVGRLIPYKRFDLIIDACNSLGKTLKIVGTGPELRALKKRAGKTVEFLGKISDEELKIVYGKAKAFIFPQREDFGITALEAMASGTPVIAYKSGGALETVLDGESGLFFDEQTVESLCDAISRFEKTDFDPKTVALTTEKFASARFKSELRHFLETAWKEHQSMLGLDYEI